MYNRITMKNAKIFFTAIIFSLSINFIINIGEARAVSASATSPGGSNGNVQFNSNGLFGGSPSLNFDLNTSRLSIGSGASTSPLGTLNLYHASNPTAYFIDLSQATDAKVWGIRNNGSKFQITANSDNGSLVNAPLTISRSNGYYVGIGSSSPSYKLSVGGDQYLSGALFIDSGNITISKKNPYIYLTDNSQATDTKQFQIRNENQTFKIVASNDAGVGQRQILTIDRSGNVGISTTTPGQKLTVVGNATISGTIDFQGQDNIKMVFEGDSLSNDATDWPGFIVKKNGYFGRAKQINVAKAGERTDQMLAEFPAEVLPNAPSRDSDEGYFFILGGTNDIFGNKLAGDIYANLKEEWRLARNAKFKVIAFTVMPSTQMDGSKEEQRQALNKLIISNPGLYDYLVRPDAFFTDPTDTRYFIDGTHLNPSGSSILADIVYTAVYKNPYMVVQKNGSEKTGADLILNPGGRAVSFGTLDSDSTFSIVGHSTTTLQFGSTNAPSCVTWYSSPSGIAFREYINDDGVKIIEKGKCSEN